AVSCPKGRTDADSRRRNRESDPGRSPIPSKPGLEARSQQSRRPLRTESSELRGGTPGARSRAVPRAAVRSEPPAGFLEARLERTPGERYAHRPTSGHQLVERGPGPGPT